MRLLFPIFGVLGVCSAKLLVDYTGGQAPSVLGNVELEGQELGCRITNGEAGNACFVKTEADSSNGKKSLHYKRDPHFRRAEVKALPDSGDVVKDKTYYIGYNFRLGATHDGLVIFQWKKADKNAAPKQNIPLYVHFNAQRQLSIDYTTPGSNGSNRSTVWTGPVSAGTGTEHHLGFVINTAQNGDGWLEFYLEGKKQTFKSEWGGSDRLKGVELFTGQTSPKFGIYRGEAAAESGQGDLYCPSNGVFTGSAAPAGSSNIYNLWVYRVQISDSSLSEISEAAGL